MKVKNLFFALPVMTGLMYGCSNDEEVKTLANEQAVSFRVQSGVPALRTTGTTVDYVNAFVVYGTDDVFPALNELIFDGITVARQQGANSFDYNPKRFYGDGATKAAFFAYSPVSNKITGISAPADMPTSPLSFNYEVITPNATGNTTQEDLLVAHTHLTNISISVALAFEHALSRIFVQARNELSEIVTIKELKLKNLYSKGTFKAEFTTTPWWTWAGFNTKIDYAYVLAPTGVAVPSATTTATLVTSMEQGMMVLPQATYNGGAATDFDAGDFALEVTYDVANLKDQTAYVLLSDGYTFEAGKQYVITIAFTGTDIPQINFTIDVSPFDTLITLP